MSQLTMVQQPKKSTTRAPVRPSAQGIADRAAEILARYSVDVLRISLGLVFFAFGILKFFPGVSPAAALVERTIETLTFGVVSGTTAVVMTAVIECLIGITLITGRFLRTGLVVLAGSLVGIMSPLVLFYADMFPDGTPTLEAQYVFKDIVLAAAGLVIGAIALGARLVVRRS
jgi:putative oxidoreductase